MTNVVSSNPEVVTDHWTPVKSRQNATWRSGDYAVIGATLQIVGELLNEAADVRATDRVLDVAAGSGNATLAAARRFATVTSTDYVPALLDRGRLRAEAEGFTNVTFEFADAEALPYPDASFDVVLSTFGVMFAPDHEQTARELMRVCKPGAASVWQIGHQAASLDNSFAPSAHMCRHPLVSVRQCFGERMRTCESCFRVPRVSNTRFAHFSSAINRRSTGSTRSGPITVLCTRHLRHSTKNVNDRSSRT
jgi:SAM-dependent methyltransferase